MLLPIGKVLLILNLEVSTVIEEIEQNMNISLKLYNTVTETLL